VTYVLMTTVPCDGNGFVGRQRFRYMTRTILWEETRQPRANSLYFSHRLSYMLMTNGRIEQRQQFLGMTAISKDDEN